MSYTWHLHSIPCRNGKITGHLYGEAVKIGHDHTLRQGLSDRPDYLRQCRRCSVYRVKYWGERTEAWRVMWATPKGE